MKKIDKLYKMLITDDTVREEFSSAMSNGSLPEFFTKHGFDPKFSEFTELLEKLEKNDSKLLENIVNQAEEESDPSIDIPPQVWNDMVNPMQAAESPPDYLINYNIKCKDARPILYRDYTIKQTLSCLMGKYKNNALLIGPAGSGKTAIAEDLGRRLSDREDPLIPEQLKSYTIYELPLSALVSGSRLVGDLEHKTREVIRFASSRNNKIILYIDEIHMLLSNDKSYNTISQMLKPALARGEIKVIGATTLQEAQILQNDPAFSRRFTRVIVDELTIEQTKSVLMDLRPIFKKHYNGKITIGRKAIDEVVEATNGYSIAGSHRPDNAITLLDRAIADLYLSKHGKNDAPIRLTSNHIKKTAAMINTGKIVNDRIDVEALRMQLSEIKGQDEILNIIVDCLKRDNVHIFERNKPLSFLCYGPSGTGKTAIANIIAKNITGTPPIRLNMAEYCGEASINRIIGSPPGYIGSDSRAELPFDSLESNKKQVILLDEYEKCHRAVKRLFLGILDHGKLQLSNNKVLSFSDAIIIASSNAGCHITQNAIGFVNDDSAKTSANISVKELSDSFEPELLNRFTKILKFRPISEGIYRDIVRDKYERILSEVRVRQKSGYKLPDVIPDEDLDKIVKESYNPEFGARPASRAVLKYMENIILEIKDKNGIKKN